MPLGMLPIADYDAREIRLQPGDKVVIYSDGFSEAENEEGHFFDKSGLRDAVRAHAHLNSAAMHAALLKEFERFTGGTILADDVTLVIIEYAP
jgi:sigma-B regulation protein RsbU (phosphoserine phosphatase)